MSLYLGFDVGTQSTKALLVDAAARIVVARAAVPYGLIEGLPPGHAEQDPGTWIDAVRDSASKVLEGVDPHAVAGIGVSGQQHGLVVLDERDRVLRPAKLWCDTSTASQARELSRRLGRPVPTGYTASKILWLKENEPEHWARTRAVLLPHDYVNFVLTGKKTMEAGDASGTGFFDSARRTFDEAAVREVDPALAEMLPPLTEAGEPAGMLSVDGAELLGLPAGIPVAAGGGDNMMSALGSGAAGPGVAVVSLGTSGTVFAYSPEPMIDPEGLIAPFCGSAGGWLPLLCVMNLTGVTEEVRAAFGVDHGELTELARSVPRGCDGLLWLPFLQGERVPDLPEATGTLLGLRPGHLRAGVLYRAALEGTSLNLGWGVGRMLELGLSVDEVHLVGGAARNALWRGILADVLGVPVVPLEEPESAALGAAIQAIWTARRMAGEVLPAQEVAAPFVRRSGAPTQPDVEGVLAYRELLPRFREAVVRTYG